MPYVSSYRKSFRRRRYPRRTTRYSRRARRPGRYTRTRRTRATANYSKQGGRVISRKTQVKFPYTWTNLEAVGANSSVSLTFVGNALIPNSSSYANDTPQPGDYWAAGVTEYSGFYDKYRVDGSSIKINISTTVANSSLEAVLIAVPTTTVGGQVSAMISTLDALDYNEIMAWQYASWKLLQAGGNNQSIWFNKFRRTRSMLGYKDAGDVQELLAEMPLTDGTGGVKWRQSDMCNWFYYLRVFNTTANASSFNIIVKMVQYTTLQNLRFRSQTEVPEG